MNFQQVTATGGFAYGVVGADIHVFGDGTPLYVLENWRPPPEPDSAWLAEQPSRMLNARFAVVGFTGREGELGELRQWCGAGAGRAARWLHAPGGQGKTRLADELAREQLRQGWKVVTATEGPGSVLPPPGSQDLRLDGAAGLLLLVDYADRWPLSSLTWLFSNALLHQPGVTTRVLLLGRSADAWPALRASLVNQQVSASTQALPPLDASGPGARDAMFRAARDAFADRYGITPPPARVDLEHEDFGLTLAVHMAALVAVDAQADGLDSPAGLAGLTVYLLDREQLNWARLHKGHRHGKIGTPPRLMNRTVFTAALAGSQPAVEGTELVDALRFGHPTAGLLADHTVCYPPPDPGRGTVLEPLYPDRLSEEFLALTVPGHTADYPAQPWAAATAAQVVRGISRPGRAVTTLAAATARWPHLGRNCLYPLLEADPAIAVAAGGAALSALAGLPDVEPYLLAEILDRIPEPVPTDLVTARATLRVRLLPARLASAGDDRAETARILVNHGNDLHVLGRDEEAADAGRQSVELFEALAAADPQEYEEHVGRALTNHASQLSRIGLNAEALAAQARVVEIFRRLGRSDPEQYDLHLATALANHSPLLEDAGRWQDAYRANQEAAAIYRRLAPTVPQARTGLAIALTNAQALTLRSSGEDGAETGMEAALEAVELWREVSAADPVSHRADLAISLFNVQTELAAAGRHQEAVDAGEESVAIYRELARADPSYREGLATALGRLRGTLVDAGRPVEAVAAGAESVTLWRRLAREAPGGHESHLLGALHEQNDALRAAGLPEDPEARARSPRVSIDSLVHRPAVTVEVYGWDASGVPPTPPPPDRAGRAAARLARSGDWPAYWELVCSLPIAEAVRLVRRIPLRRWQPPQDTDRELLMMLREADAGRTAAAVARLAEAATTRLPAEMNLFNGDYVSFSHGGAALLVATIRRDQSEAIETFDIEGGRRATLHVGESGHSALACLGPTQVVAARRLDGDRSLFEIVRHSAAGTSVLARSTAVAGARFAATATGWVAGLRLAPAALVEDGAGESRQVDLGIWGLARGDLLAADPSGSRLVLSDGHRMVTTDAGLRRALGVASMPPGCGDIRSLVFAGPDHLLTSAADGELLRWELGGYEPTVTARLRTPPLDNLFAVPVWRVVGGKDNSEARIRFYDSVTLAPVPAPAALGGVADHINLLLSSADGRFVAYGGQLAAGARRSKRSYEWISMLHDLDHPGSVLQRPLVGLRRPVLSALATTWSDDEQVRDLLTLAFFLACRSSPGAGG
ncbi:hypothetical protein ACFWBN_14460 [Streptomyces sp. NPDC059989]|uniref:hypothetical protein n=1 Tax=Streptomyces sp. NPDC059989 TaxID=3347026 RepID=UPI0036ADB4FA